ncbi:hypothetical protein ACP4OV_013961 [Aristida adscensionis]
MAGYGRRLVQLWNDWQLTAAVLLSLSLQLLLLTTGGARRRALPGRWSKAYFWVLYIGSRFIAPYALGLLSRASTGDADADIQAFWAALQLCHLAGADDFTALSLEDNTLSGRRAFELAIHVLTTGYVFFRYFLDPAFRRFLLPFWLIYVAGVIKYVEQVVALERATMKALVASVLGVADAGPDYVDFMDRVNASLRSGVVPSLNTGNEGAGRPRSGGRTKSEAPVAMKTPKQAVEIISSARFLFDKFQVLFADGIFSFKDRQAGQARFSDPAASRRAFKVVEIELSFVYDRLYTKASVSRTRAGLLLRVATLLLTLAGSIWALWATLHARQYKLRHRCVSYALLAGAVFTDVFILAAYLLNMWSLPAPAPDGGGAMNGKWLESWSVKLVNRQRWSGYMAQSNLITFCLQKLPSKSELEEFVRRLPPGLVSNRPASTLKEFVRRLLPCFLVPHLGTAPFITGVVAGSLVGSLAQEILASDGLQRYFERRSLLDQIRYGRFWKNYKETDHVEVGEELKDLIFTQLKHKESQFNAFVEWKRREKARSREAAAAAAAAAGKQQVPNPVEGRGDQALHEAGVTYLDWSIEEKEFDESLLIWHIATDLCFRQEVNAKKEGDNNPDEDLEAKEAREARRKTRMDMAMARQISNYMLYIMVVHPSMLSSSTTMAIKRCRDTCAEARRHFLKKHVEANARSPAAAADSYLVHLLKKYSSKAKDDDDDDDEAIGEKNAHVSLLEVVKVTPLQASVVKGDKSKSMLWDGCFLASELMQITGIKVDRWEIVCKVWVEMLCYAAINCGGYQHAERLKEGGELLTFVCLLMTHLGMGKHYRTEVGDAYPHLSPYAV